MKDALCVILCTLWNVQGGVAIIEDLPVQCMREHRQLGEVLTWEDALDYAQKQKDKKLEHVLLKRQPNVVFEEIPPLSLLQYVCASGYYPLVLFLLNQGGDENEKNNLGTPLLCFACCTRWNKTGDDEDNRKIIRFLLSRQHDINGSSDVGMTPFLITSLYGDRETLKLLQSRGANPKAVMDDGCTALMLAVLSQDEAMVSYLIDLMPDCVNMKRTTTGETALDCALPRDSRNIIHLLISHGGIQGKER